MGERSNRFLDPGAIPLKQRPGGNVWVQLVQWTKWAVLVAVCVLLFVLFFPTFRKTQSLQTQKEEIKKLIAAEQEKNRELTRQFELLKNDRATVERIARDRLNMGKPGEMIFRFDPYPPTAPNNADKPSAPDAKK